MKERRQYTAEGKVQLLRRHLVDGIPVPVLCEQHSIHPTIFYRWQREFFRRGHVAFQRRSPEKLAINYQRMISELRTRVQCMAVEIANRQELIQSPKPEVAAAASQQ
jgi:transposase-like protein